MKIFFSQPLEVLHREGIVNGKSYTLHLTALFTFPFRNNNFLADNTNETSIWELIEPYQNFSLLDEGWCKKNAEVLNYGRCFTRSVNKAEYTSVSLNVGKLKKELVVFGNRTINGFGVVSDPELFSSMPLTPMQAYGGSPFAQNPLGVGAEELSRPDGETYWPVPNVTYPNQVMLSRGDVLEPAGFWALPPEAPQRTKYLGKFDDQWLKTRWPELPLDSNPLYYQTAPADQQLDGYFKGDEPIRITNMHPEHAVIESQLPGVRARIFVEQRIDGALVFKEIKANADTLWLFPDQMKGCLAFRGQLEVADRDGSDVGAVFCMLEQLDQLPASLDDCYARYLSEAIPKEDESDLFAEGDDDAGEEQPPKAEPSEKQPPRAQANNSEKMAKFDDAMNAWSKPEMKKAEVTPEDLEKFMNKTEAKSQGSLLDLKKMIKKANEETLESFKKTGTTEQDLIKMLQESPGAEGAIQMLEKTPGGLAGLLNGLEDSIQQLFDLEQKMLNPDPNAPEMVAAREQFEKEEQERAVAEEAEQEESVEADPIYDREWVVAHHAAGKSFRGHELERLDLSGLNLSRADFSGAVLTKTDFTDALLTGARFDDALLSEVIFNRANLAESSFRRVSASGSEFNEAQLQKANLRDGDFTGAMFSGADLSQAILSGALCSEANFAGISADRIVADKAEWSDVNLTNAKLVEARLTHISLVGASLKGSDLSRANCLRADFSGADASDCNFSESMLQDSQADIKTTFSRSNFRKAILNEVSWDAPTLNQANLNEVQMDGADMTGARMLSVSMINVIARGAVFDKVDLERSDLSGSDMFEASFCDANLNATRLQNGNYFAADFKGTKHEGASFEGSNIERTILKIRE